MLKEQMTIAVAAEIAPAKTIIPIINKLKELEENKQLNWMQTKIIGLYHGKSSEKILKQISNETYSIGQGRRGNKKTNPIKLVYYIIKDILKTIKVMRGKNIDLLITCGNAGDVRKSIIAANFLKIPILHIEQDIYNPIEVIPLANMITAPSNKYVSFMKDTYDLKNVYNVKGYPMVKYTIDSIKEENIYQGTENYILVLLGGDIKEENLKELIQQLENLDYPVIIAPYRFDKKLIENLVSKDIKVLDNYVNLPDFTHNAKALIYAAGMGMTIEAGVLKIPSIKIEGFHKQHGSVDLAKQLNIPIVPIKDINNETINSLEPISNNDLINNSLISIDTITDLINNFDFTLKNSGFKSIKKIWNQRKQFR